MAAIFISYRRDDAAGHAGRLSDALEARFGRDHVFRDVDDIRPGQDFVQTLEKALARCEALIVVIGREWLSIADTDGRRRLDDPQDYVRLEIATALKRGIAVLPVLLEDADMPSAADLPADIAPLARRQAARLTETAWSADVRRLLEAVESACVTRDPPARRSRRRSLLMLGVAAGVAVAAGVGIRIRGSHPDIAGQWQLPDGSVWHVRQDGDTARIEDVHYQTREIWRRGDARVAGDRVDVTLTYVFSPDVTLSGQLHLDPGGRSLVGVLTESRSGREVSVVLRR
jgi:hypothetical protein